MDPSFPEDEDPYEPPGFMNTETWFYRLTQDSRIFRYAIVGVFIFAAAVLAWVII